MIESEHQLAKLIREDDLVQASLLAFKLNKLRDFFFAMDRLVTGRAPAPKPFLALPGMTQPVLSKSQDPVDSILLNQANFTKVVEKSQAHEAETSVDTKRKTDKVVTLLLEEDKSRLFELIKKLNARQQYAHLAQKLLAQILPRFSPDELIDEFKESNVLKDLLEATHLYSDKHYQRADKSLKQSYYLHFVIGQMTLQEDTATLVQANEKKDLAALDAPLKALKAKRDKKKKSKADKKAKRAVDSTA